MTVGIPKPASLPRPTPWPAGMAFGLCALLFGVLTSRVIVVGGALMTALALAGWIRELYLEIA